MSFSLGGLLYTHSVWRIKITEREREARIRRRRRSHFCYLTCQRIRIMQEYTWNEFLTTFHRTHLNVCTLARTRRRAGKL